MSSHDMMNPYGGVRTGRVMESFDPNERLLVCQRAVGEHPLPGYSPVISVNRPMRTRMPGGVGAGGDPPPATRLALFYLIQFGL
jgi:hypothetical protein